MNLSIKSSKNIRVAIPHSVSFIDAELFVKHQIDWIKKQLLKLSSIKDERIKLYPVDVVKAQSMLEPRVNELALKHGFRFNKISIKNQKSLWGSCSFKNNINLNARLLRLPSDLRDYVIFHELVHTQIKNHSPLFWSTLDNYVNQSRVCHKKLRQYRIVS